MHEIDHESPGKTRQVTESTARSNDDVGFEIFFIHTEPAVRYALVASFGYQTGREAASDAFAYAWENWSKVSRMKNPAGYVFKVGQRRGLRIRRASRGPSFDLPDPPDPTATETIEPRLESAIADLPERQRQAVLLVHGAGWTVRQASELLGISAGTTQKHLERGLEKLRKNLGENNG